MLPNNFAVSGCICRVSFIRLPTSRAARPQQRVYAVISVGCNLLTGRASWRSAGGRGGSHAALVKRRQGLLRSLVGGVPLLPRGVRLHAFNQRACKPCLCVQAMLVRHTGGRQGVPFHTSAQARLCPFETGCWRLPTLEGPSGACAIAPDTLPGSRQRFRRSGAGNNGPQPSSKLSPPVTWLGISSQLHSVHRWFTGVLKTSPQESLAAGMVEQANNRSVLATHGWLSGLRSAALLTMPLQLRPCSWMVH